MIIRNLEHLEVVKEEHNIEGGYYGYYYNSRNTANASGDAVALASGRRTDAYASSRTFTYTNSYFSEAAAGASSSSTTY